MDERDDLRHNDEILEAADLKVSPPEYGHETGRAFSPSILNILLASDHGFLISLTANKGQTGALHICLCDEDVKLRVKTGTCRCRSCH